METIDQERLQVAGGIIPVYPDNALRRARVQQLLDDCQAEVLAARMAHDTFRSELETANRRIVEAYRRINAEVPKIEEVTPFNLPGADIAIPIVRVLSIAGLGVVQLRYLAPAILNRLIASGAITRQTAEMALVELGLFTIRKGAVVSNALGLVITAAVQILIDVVIDSIAGAIEKDKLITAIREMVPMRASLRLYRWRIEKLADALKRVNDVLKVVETAGLTPTTEQLEQLIRSSLAPIREMENTYRLQHAAAGLIGIDHVRNAYRLDDVMEINANDTHLTSLEQSAVLDLWDSKRDPGAAVCVATSRHGGKNQMWRFVILDDSDQKQLLIQSALSGLVLDVYDANRAERTPVIQWNRHEGANQQWLPVYGGEEAFFLVSRNNGMVLSIAERDNLWGAPVEMREPTGQDRQLWKLG